MAAATIAEEKDFIAAVCADPKADLPRLVYADWLDEHDGESEVPCPWCSEWDGHPENLFKSPGHRPERDPASGRHEGGWTNCKTCNAGGPETHRPGFILKKNDYALRAELIRLQCRLHEMVGDDYRRAGNGEKVPWHWGEEVLGMCRRAAHIVHRINEPIVVNYPQYGTNAHLFSTRQWWQWCRGFPAAFEFNNLRAWGLYAEHLRRVTPVEEIRLRYRDGYEVHDEMTDREDPLNRSVEIALTRTATVFGKPYRFRTASFISQREIESARHFDIARTVEGRLRRELVRTYHANHPLTQHWPGIRFVVPGEEDEVRTFDLT